MIKANIAVMGKQIDGLSRKQISNVSSYALISPLSAILS